LFISVGLWKQRRPAFVAACILLTLGAIISVLKGLSGEEALVIASVLAIVIALRDGFEVQREDNSFTLSPGWLSVILGSLATIIWIASFSYPTLLTNLEAWRDFAVDNDAGRTQRALASVILTSLCLTVFQIFQQKSVDAEAETD
jgi:phosphatidylglycerol lysyltransferase